MGEGDSEEGEEEEEPFYTAWERHQRNGNREQEVTRVASPAHTVYKKSYPESHKSQRDPSRRAGAKPVYTAEHVYQIITSLMLQYLLAHVSTTPPQYIS